MKLLIIGKGGREHALAWKCAQSSLVSKVFIAPGSPAMKNCSSLVDISETDPQALANFAQKEGIELTIIGPESSLSAGVADEFIKRGLKVFGPTQAAARVESSKDFAKRLMAKAGIPTAQHKSFTDIVQAKAYVQAQGAPIVLKEDGLRAGKGVTVAMSLGEAFEALDSMFALPNKVVIEEYLEGFEFSLIALAHGEEIIPLEIAQDHKRVGDGDTGPNTGGMGAYSPVPKISPAHINEAMERVMKPMLKALKDEGSPFSGFLYGGLMLTNQGVKTIEFNARFGDPEAEAILPRLKSDLPAAILQLLEGGRPILEWDSRYSLTLVLASLGYPESSSKGAAITIPQKLDCETFHMGTTIKEGRLTANGGRVLAITALGETLAEARTKAYGEAKLIKCPKLFYRKDIGAKA